MSSTAQGLKKRRFDRTHSNCTSVIPPRQKYHFVEVFVIQVGVFHNRTVHGRTKSNSYRVARSPRWGLGLWYSHNPGLAPAEPCPGLLSAVPPGLLNCDLENVGPHTHD
jgi:hypothetical protein